ncbi:MAG: carbamoyl-phosphate synthase large subunit [Elusimicrobiota bacterium]
MPKRTDIKKILIIGSGPIVIGQACEFDYSGTQALKALKEDGYKIVLVNSNPATIMTDPEFSDRTYIEPLTCEFLEKIIEKEKPDAILPTLGGQTALNLAVELHQKGILSKYGIELIGATYNSIKKSEDRLLFKKVIEKVHLENPKSGYARNFSEAKKISEKIGFPCIIRPSFTLGGGGGSICWTKDEFQEKVYWGLSASPVKRILIEESLVGWKEYELEVMRDKNDNVVIVCTIENLDPMGIHTGDSITVAPAQTLTDKEYQAMRDAAIKIIRAIGVDTGGSNIQFAVNPMTGRLVVIEMNPRVSRSSALASKATGFPIAKIAAKLAVGYTLDEIPNDITKKTPAAFEPTIDYVVVKIPRFTFEKFQDADHTLGISMKSVGEVMAIGRTFKEAIQKAIRGLEIGRYGLGADGLGIVEKWKVPSRFACGEESQKWKVKKKCIEQVKYKLKVPNCDRIFNIKYALQLGLSVEEISELSKIDKWFIYQIKEIVELEKQLQITNYKLQIDGELLKKAKQYGFSDYQIAYLTKSTEKDIRNLRKKLKILPTYKTVDTCAGEFEAHTPYFYSTYEFENEAVPQSPNLLISQSPKIMILGGGPNRIGQGIEFDYCCVHAVFALRKLGFQTIMVNCNPETVSTDYDISDKLYFEPLTFEDVMNIYDREKPEGVIIQFGGQTPLNLARKLKSAGVKIIGTSTENIDLAEDRKKFASLLEKLKIPHADWGCVGSYQEAEKVVEKIGFPVIVRPSYVLGGRAMEVVYDKRALKKYLQTAVDVSPEHPVFIDKFLEDALEVDVDAVSNGESTCVVGIMEHIEEAGIHSGDSACMIPPKTLKPQITQIITDYTKKLARALNVKGLVNIQFAVKNNIVYILEANPRASRTVPFVSKATGIPVIKMAIDAMLGKNFLSPIPSPKANLLGYPLSPAGYVAIKESVFPFTRFSDVDPILGPEMRSTGEVMGIDNSFESAFYKAELSAGSPLPTEGYILISVSDKGKPEILPLAKRLQKLGYKILATKNTAKYLLSENIKAKVVSKIGEGESDVVQSIKSGKIKLVINIPSGKKSKLDGYLIRRTSCKEGVLLITTIRAAEMAVHTMSLLKRKQIKHIMCLQEIYKNRKVKRQLESCNAR